MGRKIKIQWELVAPVLSLAALAVFTAVFVREMASFRATVVAWAQRDLNARTALAAATLRAPLEEGDFQRVHEAGAACTREGVRLTVFTAPGGLFFDSVRPGEPVTPSLYAQAPAGDCTVRLGLPLARVLAPFERAKTGLCLAALLGGAGVLLVFYFTFRQRVRIRELKRLERFRRDFIADVSHEIKTPLTGILGAVDLLTDAEALPAENRRTLLGLIRKESVRLNALVQNILSLSRLERVGETGAVRRERVDLAELTRDAVERAGVSASARGVRLTVEVPDTFVFDCDGQLVAQALDNLIGNALRHAAAREIRVSLMPAGTGVRLTVADDGKGVAPEHAARLFERFYRVDAARSADAGGSGLGLAIVRGIARLHGGDAICRRNQPRGSRFDVTLASGGRYA